MVRSALAGAAAGALSGLLLLGLVGRLAMSVAEVVVFGLLVGAAAGAPYGALRARLRRPSTLTGAAWGVLVFLLLLLVPPPAALSAFAGVRSVGFRAVLALFGAVFLGYDLMLELLLRKVPRLSS